MEIVVIGGGVGGLTAALALGLGGHRVQVLERASRFAQAGPGLRLAPNATAVLARLGLLDQVLELGSRPARAVLRDLGSGAELAELALGAPLTARYGSPYVVVGRADLLSVLADACADADVELRPGRTVTSVDQSNFASSIMGGTVVTCASGQVYAADVVLAADGARSVARALLHLGEPSGDGWAAYRGTVSADVLGPDEAPDEVVAWVGPDAHFTRYPVRIGEVYEQVAVFRSHLYPLVGAVSPGGADQGPNGQGRNGQGHEGQGADGQGHEGQGHNGTGSGGPGLAGCPGAGWGGAEELDEAFSWAAEPVRRGVRLVRRDRYWQLLDRMPLPSWGDKRVALLGDAVHPMPAYLAQGACQAIEDAAAIAEALAGATLPPEVPAALASYQARRAPRAIRVARARQVWESTKLPHDQADEYAASDWLFTPGLLPLLRR